jgi:hypothetical protein
MSDNDNAAAAARGAMRSPERTNRIRTLNDEFRRSLTGGIVVLTSGVRELGETRLAAVLNQVRAFAAFSADNDPYGEHDFGAISCDGERLFWKIDYYDFTMTAGSPDPTDPQKTTRVLTIMLASEY